ncbi:MAG: hypothetical protein HeimC2_04470 [Candidatus Heimdallarchaeota archaeon LC_2]|nr:MAG: hypothetical protein HeimC2_04470 [Candidatus Heimdallarchaeota archaeon LC_2]
MKLSIFFFTIILLFSFNNLTGNNLDLASISITVMNNENELHVVNLNTNYIGGILDEWGSVSKIDNNNNNLILAGESRSFDIDLVNYQQTFNGGSDGLIIKYDNNGDIVFSTFLGGSSFEYVNEIALDSLGNIIVMGYTQSNDFPTTVGAYNANFTSGSQNSFLAKYNPEGLLIFSTLIGSGPVFRSGGVAVDPQDNIIVVGGTSSDIFPKLNAYQETFSGIEDGYITKFASNGSMIFSTYLGGSGPDLLNRVEINSVGEIILYGRTSSSDFPLVDPIGDTGKLNNLNLVIAKLSNDGQSLIFSTTFGGGGDDIAAGLKLDENDNILFGGMTESVDFPIVGGMKNNSSTESAFLTKITSDGQQIIFSSYVGGTNSDWIYSIEITSHDDLVITGHISSTDFPLVNPIQDTHGGLDDAFLMILSENADEILYSTYIGGSGWDAGWRLNFDINGHLFLTGFTGSDNLFLNGTIESANQGGIDFFLAEFTIEYLQDSTTSSTINTETSRSSITNDETPTFDLPTNIAILNLVFIHIIIKKNNKNR